MIAELLFVLEGNNEAAQVISGNTGDVLSLRAEEIGEVADTGRHPFYRFRTLALGLAIGLVGYQCVLKGHHLKPLTLIA